MWFLLQPGETLHAVNSHSDLRFSCEDKQESLSPHPDSSSHLLEGKRQQQQNPKYLATWLAASGFKKSGSG